MLKIAASGLIEQLLIRYQIWCDARNFYSSPHQAKVVIASDGIPSYHYLDISSINQHHNSLIAIDCLTEGIHSIDYFKQYNTSNCYLIFSNGTWDTSYYELNIDYRIIHHNYFLFDMADTYNTPNKFCYYLDKKYQIAGDKPCVFVSTIGNVRPDRDYVVNKLRSTITYKNFILRYSGQDINGNGSSDVIKVEPGEFDPYTSILEKYYHSISQTLPIDLYNQCRFNLTVETDLDWTNEFFLTEKTVKNLIIGMPFVSVSTPHFLKNLRTLGFETYSSVWDESYDDIEDFHKRVDCIVNLCNNLSTLDWTAAASELIRIGQKNQLNFLNLNAVVDREYLNLEQVINSL